MSSNENAGPSAAEPSNSEGAQSAASEIEKRILAFAEGNCKGFSNDDLARELSDVLPNQRVNAINKLLQQGALDIFTQGKVLMYKTKSTPAKGIKGSGSEERVVYSIVQESGNKGIWIKDIRIKSNLPANVLNKVIKSLENKKLIKSFNSVTTNKRKLYILYDVQPDVSVTGGAWYGSDDVEDEVVDILNQVTKKFLRQTWENAKKNEDLDPVSIRNLSSVTVKDILKYIESLGIVKVKLREEDVESLLYTVILDGCAERRVLVDGTAMYRHVEPALGTVGLMHSPCSVCPMIQKCSLRGKINPLNCSYLTSWLNE